MAVRSIATEGDPVLRKKCRPVDEIDDRIGIIMDDLADTMYFLGAIGLAASHIGVLRRIITVDTGDGLIQLANPEIIDAEGKQKGDEGSVSCPGFTGIVIRPMIVKVWGINRAGSKVTIFGKGIKARTLCHEIDQLDGMFFKSKVISGDIKVGKRK